MFEVSSGKTEDSRLSTLAWYPVEVNSLDIVRDDLNFVLESSFSSFDNFSCSILELHLKLTSSSLLKIKKTIL
jgi:hypothetical protein